MKRIIYLQIAWLTFLLGLGLATKPAAKKEILPPVAKKPVRFEMVAIGCGAGMSHEVWASSSGVSIEIYTGSYDSAKKAQKFFDQKLKSNEMQSNDSRIETAEDFPQDSVRSVGTFVNRESGAKQFVIIKREGQKVYEITANDLETALTFEKLKASQPETSKLGR